jgi:hypothetical protein
MDAAEARRWIERYTAADNSPGLTADEVDDLLGSAVLSPGWRQQTLYPRGSRIASGEVLWEALYGGWSGTDEPIWGSDETLDNTVTWIAIGTPEYDLHGAAAEGWELIAAKIAGNYDFEMEGGAWKRSQAYTHALEMAAMHRSRAIAPGGRGAGNVGTITINPPTDRIRITESGLTRAPTR